MGYSEYQYLGGFYSPIPFQGEAARKYTFHHIFRPEPAGLSAAPSGSHLAPAGQRFDHPLHIVVAIRGLLTTPGT